MGEIDKGSTKVLDKTVMAIREELMSYFKGTCVQRLVTNSSVYLQSSGIYGNYK